MRRTGKETKPQPVVDEMARRLDKLEAALQANDNDNSKSS